MKAHIGWLMTILLLIAGCSQSPSIPPTTAASEATAALDSHSTTHNGITTYVDTRSGIAFDYPSSWTMLKPPDDGAAIYTYSIATYDLNDPSAKNEGSLKTGQTNIDITFYGTDQTPDSARSTVQEDVDSGMAVIVKQETRTAPDGSPAYYYAIQGRIGGAEAQILYTTISGHTVSIAAYGDGANFEDVVKSLRKA
jgi:hypothetical protein